MITKLCPVQRAAYCYVQMRPVQVPGMMGNGRLGQPQQVMEQQVMQVWAQHHELRIYDSDDFTMYCVFCGQIDAQSHWVTVMQEQKSVGS